MAASINSPLMSPPNATASSFTDSNRESVDAASTNKTDDNSDKATQELSAVIDDLLDQLSGKFSKISEELLGKMDDMSRRLDGLEEAIQAGKSGDGK